MYLMDGIEGNEYIVCEVRLPCAIEKRMEAIGVIQGTKLTLLKKKPSALVVSIRGARFAMGKSIAENIQVNEVLL